MLRSLRLRKPCKRWLRSQQRHLQPQDRHVDFANERTGGEALLQWMDGLHKWARHVHGAIVPVDTKGVAEVA